MIIHKTGIDALDFLNEIPKKIIDQIDTINWDPPYLKKTGLKDGWKNAHNSFTTLPRNYYLSNERIEKIKESLLIMFPNAKWIKFHTNIDEIDTKQKVIVWYKPDVPLKNMIGNVEYIELSNVSNCGIYFKSKVFPIPRERNTRMMCKPAELYKKLFELINSKFVLDLFAGYGNSIKVCKSLGISIYACDIDTRLESVWQGHLQQQSLNEWED